MHSLWKVLCIVHNILPPHTLPLSKPGHQSVFAQRRSASQTSHLWNDLAWIPQNWLWGTLSDHILHILCFTPVVDKCQLKIHFTFFSLHKGFCHIDPRMAWRTLQQHGHCSGREWSSEEGPHKQHLTHYASWTVSDFSMCITVFIHLCRSEILEYKMLYCSKMRKLIFCASILRNLFGIFGHAAGPLGLKG